MGEGNTDGIFEGYKKNEDISLSSYGVLAGVFNAIFAAFLLVSRGTGRSLPERVDARDIALLGMATHKLSLVGAEDAVTSPLRAPFTELRRRAAPRRSTRSRAARACAAPWASS
jgi:hypothetical protein